MSHLKVFMLLLFCINPFLSHGQKRNTPFSTTKNFTSIRLGLTYPFFTEGNYKSEYAIESYNYQFSNKNLNYGFLGGIGVGHYFGPRFSMDLSLLLTYSRFTKTVFHFERTTNPEHDLIFEEDGNFHFSHLSLLIPLNFNFRINSFLHFGTGVFIMRPLLDNEFNQSSAIQYLEYRHGHYFTFHPPLVHHTHISSNNNYNKYWRQGFHVQLSYLLKEKDWQQKRINIEYYHSLTRANFNVFEKWIVVSFKKIFYQ
ncbi:MAG TPA: hypothetical protein VFG10_16950 [Saprospiraceae bacterium]|nr:hypothetical protein [Saprospiraceae bacterium]